jgi:hypothetical protein
LARYNAGQLDDWKYEWLMQIAIYKTAFLPHLRFLTLEESQKMHGTYNIYYNQCEMKIPENLTNEFRRSAITFKATITDPNWKIPEDV